MTNLTLEQIAQLERLERAARPGPWSKVDDYVGSRGAVYSRDARFIEAMRNNGRALLTLARRALAADDAAAAEKEKEAASRDRRDQYFEIGARVIYQGKCYEITRYEGRLDNPRSQHHGERTYGLKGSDYVTCVAASLIKREPAPPMSRVGVGAVSIRFEMGLLPHVFNVWRGDRVDDGAFLGTLYMDPDNPPECWAFGAAEGARFGISDLKKLLIKFDEHAASWREVGQPHVLHLGRLKVEDRPRDDRCAVLREAIGVLIELEHPQAADALKSYYRRELL